jgi:polysaccharide biosynthesis protein PslG
VVTALAVGGAVVPASSAQAPAARTHQVHVPKAFFGMHDASLMSLSRLSVGSIRVWDTGATWHDIEGRRGHYDWTRLDHIVTDAQKHHLQVTLVTAMTPHTYAAKPTLPPRRITAYQDFVRHAMKRYRDFNGRRGIAAYQVWNEANVVNFWTGTPYQMARLTKAAWQVRNHTDPGATIVAPALTARLPSQRKWAARYEAQRIDGVPVWHYYDAAAFNLYPLPRYGARLGTPEDAMVILGQVRDLLRQAGVPTRKPIWNTEVNYGLQTGPKGGTHAIRIPKSRQAANVIRTYLLNAAAGIKRVFWYAYDMGRLPKQTGGGTLGNTQLSVPGHPTRVTLAGNGLDRVRDWLKGRLVGIGGPPCARDDQGTYTCIVKSHSGTRRIYWNPTRRASVVLAPGASYRQEQDGGIHAVKGGSRLTVDYRPVMVESPH